MVSALEKLRRELSDAMAGADDSALEQSPPGKWNSAQILEHLYITYKNTNWALAKCLEKGAPLATKATLKHRFGTLLVVKLGYMPPGRRAPERALPQGMPLAEVRVSIFAEIQRMESALADCERRFGPRAKILDHPFIGPLTADEWRKFHWVHGRHHAKQIRERAAIPKQA
jgi:hypothetical protein